jgi:ABC-type glycerol-3-phosphate transport system substrate-binding protein
VRWIVPASAAFAADGTPPAHAQAPGAGRCGPGLSRRRLAGLAAGSAAALGACGPARASPARPQVATPRRRIRFSPWFTAAPWSRVQPLLAEALAPFQAAQRGLEVVLVPPPGGCCNPGALAAAVIAGTAPDVLLNNNFGPLVESGYLLALDSYLSQDNVNLRLWSEAQMASFVSGGSTYALPTYCNTAAYFVNLSVFDDLGLGYPDPGWDSTEFLRLARRLTGSSGGQHRYGCNLWWWTGQGWGSDWILRGFGGAKVGGAGTSCELGTEGSVAAGRWIYEEVLWPGVGTCQDTLGGYEQQFATGQTVMSVQQTGTLASGVTSLGRQNVKWAIYPFPAFPAQRAVFGGDQFYAINATTAQPQDSWELLRWVCAETAWQRTMIRMFLMAPALISLWEEWRASVAAIAPVLEGKDLAAFSDPAVSGYAIPSGYFRYSDAQAETIIGQAYAALFARRQTAVTAVFRQTAGEIDALEATGAAQRAATLAAAAAFPSVGPPVAAVPAGE